MSSKSSAGDTPAQSGEDQGSSSAFALAEQISQLLAKASNKNAKQALEMVAALRGLRVISADRPIGLTNVGKQQPTTNQKKPKAAGKQPAPAAWKQTPEYKQAIASRESCLSKVKSHPADDEEKKHLLAALHAADAVLKNLRQSKAGN
jgi:hypothetical protein